MPDQRRFEVGLRVFVAQIEELEDVGVLDLFLGQHHVARLTARALSKHRRLVSRQRRALVELGLNLAIELAHRPAGAQGLGFVETPGVLILYRQQANLGRPGQRKAGGDLRQREFCRQSLQNRFLSINTRRHRRFPG